MGWLKFRCNCFRWEQSCSKGVGGNDKTDWLCGSSWMERSSCDGCDGALQSSRRSRKSWGTCLVYGIVEGRIDLRAVAEILFCSIFSWRNIFFYVANPFIQSFKSIWMADSQDIDQYRIHRLVRIFSIAVWENMASPMPYKDLTRLHTIFILFGRQAWVSNEDSDHIPLNTVPDQGLPFLVLIQQVIDTSWGC